MFTKEECAVLVVGLDMIVRQNGLRTSPIVQSLANKIDLLAKSMGSEDKDLANIPNTNDNA